MMQPALDKIEAAKKAGSWQLFDEVEKGIRAAGF